MRADRATLLLLLAFGLLLAPAASAVSIPLAMEPPSLVQPFDCEGCGATRSESGLVRTDFLEGEYDGATTTLVMRGTIEAAAEPFEPNVSVEFDVPVLGVSQHPTPGVGNFIFPRLEDSHTADMPFMTRMQGLGGTVAFELAGLPGEAWFETNADRARATFAPAVPEPSAVLAFGLGAALVAGRVGRRR